MCFLIFFCYCCQVNYLSVRFFLLLYKYHRHIYIYIYIYIKERGRGPVMSLGTTTRWCKPNGLNTQHVLKVRQTQKTPLVCPLPPRPHMTLLLSLPLKSHDIYPPNPFDLFTLYLKISYLPQPQKALFSLKLHSPKNGYQEIKQIASNSSYQADPQEVLKLRKETRLS